ncbi:DUF6390 family protein [Kribbella ginsengisoli]|uniref:DUF6390 family protein n=1 Tax=Kribbella ginsengisoli TaxID=363865 RepID=A0ABP6YPJ3_9ACTN
MVSGPILFVRYALAPNLLGYCGPADCDSLLAYGSSGEVDDGLRERARQFEGAWPYLEMIASKAGLRDPLDHRVVEAYWLGNALLDDVGPLLKAHGMPHHSYQVFCCYPWADLLPDDRASAQALHVLDQCRIRWGRVISDLGTHVLVESRPLAWDGHALSLGTLRKETVIRGTNGLDLLGPLSPGDWVSLHWQWVCDRIDLRRVTALRHYSAYHLNLTNRRLVPSDRT